MYDYRDFDPVLGISLGVGFVIAFLAAIPLAFWYYQFMERATCKHDWMNLYGDSINMFNARSVCKKCHKRSQVLQQEAPK
jgi:hypothetical protein